LKLAVVIGDAHSLVLNKANVVGAHAYGVLIPLKEKIYILHFNTLGLFS